ncbi:MAG: D-alanine--D-alanine ligase [Gammaproteobacteria bacterium]|nr:D-alanine--D-alanine ligase [Gammaproteobacteria bacterium]
MTTKLQLAVLCGGQSTEHEISLISARNVVTALAVDQYDVQIIYISKKGAWYLLPDAQMLLQYNLEGPALDPKKMQALLITPGEPEPIAYQANLAERLTIDCVIPILHGSHGEDGMMQGLLEILDLPYVGADALSSAVCMNKHTCKALLAQAGLPVVPWQLVARNTLTQFNYAKLKDRFGEVLFIKPVSLGSSIGINKVHDAGSYVAGLDDAFRYTDHVIVEPTVVGREIEIAVLGDDDPIASLPGEIVSHHEFYSYQAKYLDPKGADLIAPAELSNDIIEKLQELAMQAFIAVGCSGMARVDFFVTADDNILINEINTIPGFTNISMYPRLWVSTGLATPQLLERLIGLALTRYQQQKSLLCDWQASDPVNTTLS